MNFILAEIAKEIFSSIIIPKITSYGKEDTLSSVRKVLIELEKEICTKYPGFIPEESALAKSKNMKKIITWILEENIYESEPKSFDIENFDGSVLSLEEENFIFQKLRDLISKDDILKEYVEYNMIKDINEITRSDYEANRGSIISDEKIDNYINRKIKSLDGMNEIKTNLCNVCIDKKKVILLADAGMGKSEELKYLNEKVSGKDGYKSYPYDLSSYVDETIESYIQFDRDYKRKHFIILDGFDEIEAQNTNTFIKRLEKFIEKYEEEIIILISSRKNFYRLSEEEFSGTLKDFSEYELSPLDDNLIEEYIEKQLECKKTFIEEVSINDFEELLKNPFYLKELIKIYKIDNTLPERINLMDRIIEIRISKDEDKFRTTKEINDRKSEIIKTLESLALSLQLMGKQQISMGEYQDLLNYDQRELIKYIGLWVKEDVVNWKFKHNNFKEYLVAKYLSGKKLEEVKKIVTYKQMPNKINQSWINVLSFMVYLDDNKELIEWLIEKDPYLIIQFEVNIADRKKRNEMIVYIFEQYKEKNISIRDGEKTKKMAKFGESRKLVSFLVKEFEDDLDEVGFYNAALILQYFTNFYDYEEKLRQIILEYCKNPNTNDYIKQVLIKLLSNSKIFREETAREVIDIFHDDNDTYIRTTIYNLMLTCKLQNTHIDFLIDGLEIYNSHRDGIVNIGEKIYLEKNIESIDSSNGIIKILDHLIEVDQEDLVSWNHNNANELFLLIKDKAEMIYQEENKEILEKIRKIFIKSSLEFNYDLMFSSKEFLINQEEVFSTYLLIMEEYQDEEYIANCFYEIMNNDCIDDFIERYKDDLLINKQAFIKYSHRISVTDYRYEDIISLVFKKDNIEIAERRVSVSESEKRKSRQVYFDSLFDQKKYLDLVCTFKEVNMKRGYLSDDRRRNNENKKELDYLYQDCDIYRNNTITKLDSFIDKLDSKLYWEEFSIDKIIRRLTRDSEEIKISDDQKKTYRKILL